MLVNELVNLFRQYVDEPDQTYLSDIDVQTYLQLGYKEFRNMITDYAPFTYATKVRIDTINQRSVATIAPNFTNLNNVVVTIEGATVPAGNKLERIIRIYRPISDDVTNVDFHADSYEYQAVTERKALYTTFNSYWLGSDARIYFDSAPGVPLVIEYAVDIDVTVFALPFLHVWFDRFDQFHDVIALLASKHYAIREQAENPVAANRLQERIIAMREFFLRRDYDGPSYVGRIDEDSFIF
tara:strand:- start:161 stop:880 length:720 start_codon:yes stop_codon:yes gene_type:complete